MIPAERSQKIIANGKRDIESRRFNQSWSQCIPKIPVIGPKSIRFDSIVYEQLLLRLCLYLIWTLTNKFEHWYNKKVSHKHFNGMFCDARQSYSLMYIILSCRSFTPCFRPNFGAIHCLFQKVTIFFSFNLLIWKPLQLTFSIQTL